MRVFYLRKPRGEHAEARRPFRRDRRAGPGGLIRFGNPSEQVRRKTRKKREARKENGMDSLLQRF